MKSIIKKIVINILEAEAKLVLRRFKPKIVGVTGNIGKTTTKDVVASVLSAHMPTRKSEKSYNSEFGIPLTIIGAESGWNNPFAWIGIFFHGLTVALFTHEYPKVLVLEIGADRPGDIKRTLSWLPIDVGVITYVGEKPVHVEFFSSPEELAREKGLIAPAVQKNGLLILNHDNPIVYKMKDKAKCPVASFGYSEAATIRASHEHVMYENGLPTGITFKVDYQGKIVPVRIAGVIGRQVAYSAMPAILAGVHFGMNLVQIDEALAKHVPTPGRVHLIAGVKGSVVIDDTYNSSPHALEASLYALEEIQTVGKKIAVLGDMMELGRLTIDAHETEGDRASRIVSRLVTVGQRGRFIAEGARKAGMPAEAIQEFDDSESAGAWLQNELGQGDIVLVKGSQFVRMEKCVKEIMAEPGRAHDLLVRQDREWQGR